MSAIIKQRTLHEIDEHIYELERNKFGRFGPRVYLFSHVRQKSMFISVCPATLQKDPSLLSFDVSRHCKMLFGVRNEPLFEIITILEYSLNHCSIFSCDPRLFPWVVVPSDRDTYPTMIILQKYEFIIQLRNHILTSYPSMRDKISALCSYLQELLDISYDDVALSAFHRNGLDIDYYASVEKQDLDVGNDYAVAVNILPNILRSSFGIASMLSYKLDVMLRRAGIMCVSMIASPLWFLLMETVNVSNSCLNPKQTGYPYVRPLILKVFSNDLSMDEELVADVSHSVYSNIRVTNQIMSKLDNQCTSLEICKRLLSITLSRYNNYPLWSFAPHTIQVLSDRDAFGQYTRAVVSDIGLRNGIAMFAGASSYNIEVVNKLYSQNHRYMVKPLFTNLWQRKLPIINGYALSQKILKVCSDHIDNLNIKLDIYKIPQSSLSEMNECYSIGITNDVTNYDLTMSINQSQWRVESQGYKMSDGRIIREVDYLTTIIFDGNLRLKNDISTFVLPSAENKITDIVSLITSSQHCVGTMIPVMGIILNSYNILSTETYKLNQFNLSFCKFTEESDEKSWVDYGIDPVLFFQNHFRLERLFDVYHLYQGFRGVSTANHLFKQHMIFLKDIDLSPICGFQNESQTVLNNYNFMRKCASTDLRLYFEFSDLSAYKARFQYLLTKFSDVIFTSKSSPLALFENGGSLDISGHLIALFNLYMLYGIDLRWYFDTIQMHMEKKDVNSVQKRFVIERDLVVWHSKHEYNLTFGYIEKQISEIGNVLIQNYMQNVLVYVRNRMRF